jgi:hypothetical protein
MIESSRIDTLLRRALQQLDLERGRNDASGRWTPRSPELTAALDALRGGDVGLAVERLEGALERRSGDDASGEVRVLRHVLVLYLDAESDRLEETIRDSRTIRQTAEGEMHLLDLRLARQRFRRSHRLGRITLACAVVILMTTALAVTRFGLAPAIALSGLAVFAIGAWLLLRVDARRQRSAHDRSQNLLRAEVAEEQQILRVDIRQRTALESGLERRRAELAALRDRVVAVHESGDPTRRRTT